MTEATRAALESIEPIRSDEDDYFGISGQPFTATIPGEKPDKVYLVEEGLRAVAPVDEEYQRSFVVTDPEDRKQPRRLTFWLEQEDPDKEDEARAELLIDASQVAESPEVVKEVLGQVMERYYLRRVVAREEDVAVVPSDEQLDKSRFLARAGFKEGDTPGTFELRAAA